MSKKYSRVDAQCDYCGDILSRHNLKEHNKRKHDGKPFKERLKRQGTLEGFVQSAPKKAKEAENVTLEEEDETGITAETDDPNENEREKVHNDTDVKTILDNTEKILKGINELKETKNKEEKVKETKEPTEDKKFHELDKARTIAEVLEACPELVHNDDFKTLRCKICAKGSDKYETTRYSRVC